jgi:hypothetical protein
VGVGDDVAQRVGQAVAGPLGQEQRAIVEDAHEAGRIAARADVAAPGAIAGGQEHERRALDERPGLGDQPIGELGAHQRRRLAQERAQRGLVVDGGGGEAVDHAASMRDEAPR